MVGFGQYSSEKHQQTNILRWGGGRFAVEKISMIETFLPGGSETFDGPWYIHRSIGAEKGC